MFWHAASDCKFFFGKNAWTWSATCMGGSSVVVIPLVFCGPTKLSKHTNHSEYFGMLLSSDCTVPMSIAEVLNSKFSIQKMFLNLFFRDLRTCYTSRGFLKLIYYSACNEASRDFEISSQSVERQVWVAVVLPGSSWSFSFVSGASYWQQDQWLRCDMQRDKSEYAWR